MPARFVVAGPCAKPCAACVGCRPIALPTAEEIDARAQGGRIDLGGGDATTWPGLWHFLELSKARPERRIWVEAPAFAFDAATLARLKQAGCHGVVIQLESAADE